VGDSLVVIGRRLTEAEVAAYDVVDPERARKVRIVAFRILPPHTAAMTLDTVILLGPSGRSNAVLLAHELVHVRQWGEFGIAGFLRHYLAEYTRNLVRLRQHHLAYLSIPLESQARDEADSWRDRTLRT
jgi:hypothetical protein